MSAKAMTGESKRKYFKRAMALILVSAVFITSAFSVAAFSTTVDVTADGKTVTVTTMSQNTNEILAKAGIKLGEDDEVVRLDNDSRTSLEVLRAFNVTVNAHGNIQDLIFTKGTVEDALNQAEVTLESTDSVYPSESEQLTPNMEIVVDTMYTVKIKADGDTKEVDVPKGTVENALSFLNIKLGKDDILSVKASDQIENGMEISIQRVTFKEVTTTEEVKFETKTTETSDMENGKKETKVKGENGEKEIVTRQKIVDGKVTEEEKISEEVTKKPIDEEILVGTKVAQTAQASSEQSAYQPTVSGSASYTQDDLYCLTAVIWQEAGALYASDQLQQAVASVVVNHVYNPAFPNSIRECLLRPGAYGTMAWDGINLPSANDSATAQALQRCENNARIVLEQGGTLPRSVIYQTNQVMGSGLYNVIDGVYFSYQ